MRLFCLLDVDVTNRSIADITKYAYLCFNKINKATGHCNGMEWQSSK